MDIAQGNPLRDRSEPRGVTIGDLAALIAGIALVLVLPTRQSYWPLPTDFLGPWPRWLPWFFCLGQALGAACVALVPVVLWRRACHGGQARPAEFLAVCAAMPYLAVSIETALIRLSFQIQTGQGPPGPGLHGMPSAFVSEWSTSAHWTWEQALLFTGALALVVFLLGRRVLPGWLSTALLILAWLGAYEAGLQLLRRGSFLLLARFNGRPIGEPAGVLISSLIFHLPRAVLYAVPAVAVFHDLRRERRARPSWLEWTGLGLASALFVIAQSTELVRHHAISAGSESWVVESVLRALTFLAALPLGHFLYRVGKDS